MRWAVHIACMTEMKNPYTVSVGKREEKRLFGRPRLRRENNIRINLREIGCESMN
jgi:hypothetical protein